MRLHNKSRRCDDNISASLTGCITSHLFSAILETHNEFSNVDERSLLKRVKEAVLGVQLTPVGEIIVLLEPYGTSLVLLLKESHVAVHYWPEFHKFTIDIHVCNYRSDNLDRARALATELERVLEGRPVGGRWLYQVLSA